MLLEIYIKNYTIVDQLHLILHPGLSILSGETGAGKSILVDSISLVLGARADTKAIRVGQPQCELTLSFDVKNIPNAKSWLSQHGFLEESNENECLLTRTITKDGRSRSSLNGRPCPLHLIRELSSLLLIIHGQHDSQHLLKQETQQAYVDQFGDHEALLQELHTCYSAFRQNETNLQELKKQAHTRHDQISLFTFQLEELQSLNLGENEWQTLHAEHQTLHEATTLVSTLNQALHLTSENERANALSLLHQALEQLHEIHLPEKQLNTAKELLNIALIHIQEATDELQQFRSRLELSPQRLSFIENRLTLIHDLARKHHVSAEELHQVKKSIQQKLEHLEASEESIAALTLEQHKLLSDYHRVATLLSKNRKQIAKEISQKVTASMQELGLEGGEFEVSLHPLEETVSKSGLEKIIFLVKTNPGQPIQPLTQVVSGGELSRLSLALQAMIAAKDNTPTFIFDEVDTGIGGKTAQIVGQLLRALGTRSQVFCITHLAQVAAEGNHHYQVSKSSTENSTTAHIQLLNEENRIQELARMLSGKKISKQTLLHAKELLTQH